MGLTPGRNFVDFDARIKGMDSGGGELLNERKTVVFLFASRQL
jgi:hypothetical protein